MKIRYSRYTQQSARELRQNMTPQERRLWYTFLKTYPVQFRRQKQIDQYIVDFFCSSANLIIELDGSQHYDDKSIEYDAERTEKLSQNGFMVIRFTNTQIDREFDNVCREIDRTIRERCTVPEEVGSF